MFQKFCTILGKICSKVEIPVKSTNISIFQIPIFLRYSVMFNLADICCRKLKLCEQHWFGREGGGDRRREAFSLKIDVLFLFAQDCWFRYFLKKLSKIGECYSYVGALYSLNSINSKLWKWYVWINDYVQR